MTFEDVRKAALKLDKVLVSINWSTLNGGLAVYLKEFNSEKELEDISNAFLEKTLIEGVRKGGQTFKVWPKSWKLHMNYLDMMLS